MKSLLRAVLTLGLFVFANDAARGARPSSDPLPSWNQGAAKRAIMDYVHTTTTPSSPRYVPREQRIAVFDQDGTTWVSHPIYTQLVFCLDRVPAYVAKHPALRDTEPFKTVLSGDRAKIAKLSKQDLEKIAVATLSGMTVDQFTAEVKRWIATARDPRWHKHYTELTYQPMLEVMKYLRAAGYKVYIVTGGGQDFVRAYALDTYGLPPERIVGTAGGVSFRHAKDGRPILMKDPHVLLVTDKGGKPASIHLMIGQRPHIAFGNSNGDRQMLEYTGAGKGARLSLLLLHDDARREYAYGPAQGLPNTKVGTFSQSLYDEAKAKGWIVISMKHDWNRIFAFPERAAQGSTVSQRAHRRAAR